MPGFVVYGPNPDIDNKGDNSIDVGDLIDICYDWFYGVWFGSWIAIHNGCYEAFVLTESQHIERPILGWKRAGW